MAVRPLLFTYSLLLAVFCFSQEKDSLNLSLPDTTLVDSVNTSYIIKETHPDSVVKTNRRLISVSFYLDYGKLLMIPSEVETKYEGGIELLIRERFPVILEAGSGTLTPEGAYANGIYESDGMYFRVGAGYMNEFTPKNKIGISLRFGGSVFNETGRIFIESPSGVQETFIQTIDRPNLSAIWWEAVLYTDKKLLKNSDLLSVGLNLRLRVLQDYDRQEDVDVYAIPGYGRAFDKTVPAANFFVKINL